MANHRYKGDITAPMTALIAITTINQATRFIRVNPDVASRTDHPDARAVGAALTVLCMLICLVKRPDALRLSCRPHIMASPLNCDNFERGRLPAQSLQPTFMRPTPKTKGPPGRHLLDEIATFSSALSTRRMTAVGFAPTVRSASSALNKQRGVRRRGHAILLTQRLLRLNSSPTQKGPESSDERESPRGL